MLCAVLSIFVYWFVQFQFRKELQSFNKTILIPKTFQGGKFLLLLILQVHGFPLPSPAADWLATMGRTALYGGPKLPPTLWYKQLILQNKQPTLQNDEYAN